MKHKFLEATGSGVVGVTPYRRFLFHVVHLYSQGIRQSFKFFDKTPYNPYRPDLHYNGIAGFPYYAHISEELWRDRRNSMFLIHLELQ